MIEFLDGNDAVVRGALDAGCDFFAGYPITPATPILLSMMQELPARGGVAIQGEDEIASIGFCIGAAMTGKKVLTATSGPGMSLYSENIGLALMGEVPMIIVDVQRLGPATGSATKDAGGDIQFVRWITSGGYPVIALSPSSVEDCYLLTKEAFRLAFKYRTPVFILSSKEIAQTRMRVNLDELAPLSDEKIGGHPNPDHKMVIYNGDGMIPPQLVGTNYLTRFTGSSHDEYGNLTKSPQVLAKLDHHLNTKLTVDEFSWFEYHGPENPEELIISYGVVSRACRRAWTDHAGPKTGLLILKTLWPVPESVIKKHLQGVKKVLVPEMNNGQYAREIKLLMHPDQELIPINQVNSELIFPQTIAAHFSEGTHV